MTLAQGHLSKTKSQVKIRTRIVNAIINLLWNR